jgi:glutathione S-transferase
MKNLMPPILYAHPFSSYCQKVLIALYENRIQFEYRNLDGAENTAMKELEAKWPLKRFPILVDGKRTVIETSIIIEYLQLHHRGPQILLPEDADAALEVRTLDRFFDNYISTPLQRIVLDSLREPEDRDVQGVREARQLLDQTYAWLDQVMSGREWAAGSSFSLADCAAAPALFYSDWAHAISDDLANLLAYRKRLLARPSFARAVDEARPYRSYFPLGAPDRD